MACVAKWRGRYVLDFRDQFGVRQWITMKKGTTKAKAEEELRVKLDQVAKGVFVPDSKALPFSEVARDWLEHKKPNLRATTWEVYEGHVRNHFHDLDGLKINKISIATMKILTPCQIQDFLSQEHDPKYQMLFSLAIFTGAREGELLGLKWSDVDWEKRQIWIQRTFNKGRFFPPKAKTSRRRIDLAPKVVNELRKWKLACPKNKRDLVFPNKAGESINHSNMVQRNFLPGLKAASLPRIRFHDLRHTYASLLIEQGENIKYIQTQMGHSSPMVTLTVYAHLLKPANQEAACRLENTIFGKDGSKMVAEAKKGPQPIAVTP